MMHPCEIVAAMDARRGIGLCGDLPWRLPAELLHFRELTQRRTIIMGAETARGLAARGRRLDTYGRTCIAVTRTGRIPHWAAPAASLADALAMAGRERLPIVIGGAQLFSDALPHAIALRLSVVWGSRAFDTRFPPLDWQEWRCVKREKHDGFSTIVMLREDMLSKQ